MRFVLTEPAESDLQAARDFYVDLSPPISDRFLAAFDSLAERLLTFPESAQLVHQTVRRARVQGFPYAAFYEIQDDRLVVLAVMHTARHQDRWKSRV